MPEKDYTKLDGNLEMPYGEGENPSNEQQEANNTSDIPRSIHEDTGAAREPDTNS